MEGKINTEHIMHVEYYKVEDLFENPQEQIGPDDPSVIVTAKAEFSKQEYQDLLGGNNIYEDNSIGRFLMIFNDNSGSMGQQEHGGITPFKCLNKACINMADQLFDQ